MTFKPSNQLEESLVKATQDPAHRPQFHRDLLAFDIFLIQQGPSPDRPGRRVAGEGERCPDPPVDFMRLTGRADIEEYFGEECRPFYERLLG